MSRLCCQQCSGGDQNFRLSTIIEFSLKLCHCLKSLRDLCLAATVDTLEDGLSINQVDNLRIQLWFYHQSF